MGQTKAQPSPEQLAALVAFACAQGRYWKRDLRHAWETGLYDRYLAADSMNLQQIRNEFGPTWLTKFKLSEVR